MYPILKKRWFLYLCVYAFVLCKLRDLSIAFYWDESWVYVPGVKLMYEHGPSLLPGAIPLEYSRGHPLLFQAMCTVWMNIFGTSNVAMHSFALFVFVVLALVLYEIMLRLFGMRAAMISVVLLLLNHAFFVNSSFVLNDVMLGLFFLLVIWFYVSKRYVAAAVFLTLAFYTKESGLVVGCIIGMDIVVAIVKREPIKQVVYKALCLVVPVLLIGLFFVIQKHMLGWYLNPGHTSLIDAGIDNTLDRMRQTFGILFSGNSNSFYWGMAMLLPVVVAATQMKAKSLLLLLPAFLFCSLLVLSGLVLVVRTRQGCYSTAQVRFIKLCAATGAAYVYFCCINFFELRYLLPAMLLISVVLLSIVCDHFAGKLKGKVFGYFMVALVMGGVVTFTVHEGELSIRDRIVVQQELTDYFEANNFYDRKIFCYPFLEREHLTNARTGFLHSDRTFKHVTELPEDNVELMIYDNIEPNAPDSLRYRSDFYLLQRIEEGTAWVAIYKRR